MKTKKKVLPVFSGNADVAGVIPRPGNGKREAVSANPA
jgi:hypothetical protein